MEYREIIEQGLTFLGLTWTESQADQLSRYCREIELWNPRYNLVRSSGRDFVERHIFDALSALPVLLSGNGGGYPRIADVGSGNGIPGIPLAVMFPGSTMVLIERSGKRAGFLRNAAAAAGLHPRVTVFEGDVREVNQTFTLVTFRAVSSLGGILPLLMPLVEEGSEIAAYKGRDERVSQELESVALGERKSRITVENLVNPFLPDHQRQLVRITFPCT